MKQVVIKNPFERKQKGTVSTLCVVCMIFFAVAGCGKQNFESGSKDEGEDTPFYFYEGNEVNEIPLRKIEEKIFIQFALPVYIDRGTIDWEQWEIDWEQWSALISSVDTLQPYKSTGAWTVLESVGGQAIPPAIIEYFKASPVVASASYVFEVEYNEILQGLKNEIAVQLKETTSYKQLLQLAEEHSCKVEREDTYVKNLFFITIPKTSELDAMQMSALFYGTGLFESVQPVFAVLNQMGDCDEKIILKVLNDEPAIVRKQCFDHVGRVDTFFFELANRYPYEFFADTGIFPVGEIPQQYRQEGLSVYISGNVTSCVVATIGCLDTKYYRLRPNYLQLFELKSIKIK